MNRPSTYGALPMRARFGAGVPASLSDEVAEIGLRRVLEATSRARRASWTGTCIRASPGSTRTAA